MITLKSVGLIVLSFLLSHISTPSCATLSKVTGAIDRPDGKRKINDTSIPRLGGLAFFTAFFASAVLAGVYRLSLFAALLSGGSALVAGGVADDTFNLPPPVKLAVQIAAAGIAISFIRIPTELSFLGLFSIPLSSLAGAALALFRVIFTINAVNFSDGLDGLASGLSVVALISLAVLSYASGANDAALASALLTAAVIGFIPHNKYRAKIFMGDSGSQFLGFAIAVISLSASGGTTFSAETALFLSVPVLDTWLSVIRRIIKGKSPFSADKGHLHHLLISKGVSHPTAVKILVLSSAAVASVTLIVRIL
jgi:UDP-GlcNAc:undecaprenyl-phosphate GlcNAc-1-phosphate transferase